MKAANKNSLQIIVFFLALLLSGQSYSQRVFIAGEGLNGAWEKTVETLCFKGDIDEINQQMEHLQKCRRVNHVILSNPMIETIPEKVFDFPRLSRIEFDECTNLDFTKVCQQIKEKQGHLVSIIFKNMDFSNITLDRKFGLKYLEELSFIKCTGINEKLNELVAFLDKGEDGDLFKNFKYLRLDECGIRSENLPESFRNLSKLVSLSMVKNELDSFNVKLPSNLIQLDISFNQFNHFPIKPMKYLQKIKFLSIDCNQLDSTQIMKALLINRIQNGKCRGKNKLKSYTYSCNEFDGQEGILSISQQLNCAATWSTGVKLPINDFRPLQIDCEECMAFKHKNSLMGKWQAITDTNGSTPEVWIFEERTIHFSHTRTVKNINKKYPYQLRELANSDFLALKIKDSSLPECLLKIGINELTIVISEGDELRELKFERDVIMADE